MRKAKSKKTVFDGVDFFLRQLRALNNKKYINKIRALVIRGVLSKRLHLSDAGADLFVGSDEGDAVIKFYETLAERY